MKRVGMAMASERLNVRLSTYHCVRVPRNYVDISTRTATSTNHCGLGISQCILLGVSHIYPPDA